MSELNERILDCPDCENQGWYVVENLKTGEPLQEQCKFCGTEERSVFNIVTKLEAKNAVQEDRIIDLINCNKVMQSECDELESRVKHIEAKEDIKDRVLMPRELTAENGAKGLLIGEFSETVIMPCEHCQTLGFVDDEACEECTGAGDYSLKVGISWATIKDIYKMAVKNLATQEQPSANEYGRRL